MKNRPAPIRGKRILYSLTILCILSGIAFLILSLLKSDESLRMTTLNDKPFWDELHRSQDWPIADAVIFENLLFDGGFVVSSGGRSASATINGERIYIFFYQFNGKWYRTNALLSFYPGNRPRLQERKDPRVLDLEKRLRMTPSIAEQEQTRTKIFALENGRRGPRQLRILTDNGCWKTTDSDTIGQCIEKAGEAGALVYTTVRVNPDRPSDAIIEF